MTRLQLNDDTPPVDPLVRGEARKAVAARLAAATAKPSQPDMPRVPVASLDASTIATQQPALRLHQLLDSLRQAAGLSISDLAEEVESTNSDIQEILTGQAIPGHDFLDELLQACQAGVAQRLTARELLRTRARPTSGQNPGSGYVFKRPAGPVRPGGDQRPHQHTALLSDDELLIRTPADLAQVFQAVLDRAGLTAGQLAIKAKISRSQVYSMKKAGSGSVPRNPEQISRWLFTCGVPPKQAHVIMERWKRLDVLRRQGKIPELPPEPSPVREEPDMDEVFTRLLPQPRTEVQGHVCASADADPCLPEPEAPPARITADAQVALAEQAFVLEDKEMIPRTHSRGSTLLTVASVLVTEYSPGRALRTVVTLLMLMVAIVVLLHLGPGTMVQVIAMLNLPQ